MWHFTEILSKFMELLVGCPVTALHFTVRTSISEWATNLSEACPGRPVKDLNVLLPQLLPIISPGGYYYQMLIKKACSMTREMTFQRSVGSCIFYYLLSNLETPQFGCFIDSADILDYVFRKLDSFLYTWRTCFQWKASVGGKKLKQCYCWNGNCAFCSVFSFSSSQQLGNPSRNPWSRRQCGWLPSE